MRDQEGFIDLFFARRVLSKLPHHDENHLLFLATLFSLSRRGHLCLDLSGQQEYSEEVKQGAQSFPFEEGGKEWVVNEGSLYYLKRHFVYETTLLTHLERLHLRPALAFEEPHLDPSLNCEQKEAVRKALLHPLSFLTGGPGTGKTFTAAHIVRAFLERRGPQTRILLTAPTGKAAFQLEAAIRRSVEPLPSLRAGTLHALLGLRNREERQVAPLFADLILVDESSMIDVRLFSALLSSVQNGAHLIFIGDKDQLPPVEAGSLFADLVESGRYPVTTLIESVRCNSSILVLADAIREGKQECFFSSLEEWIDLERRNPHSLLDELWDRFGKRDPLHFSILSCIKGGPLGVEAINAHFLRQAVASSSSLAIPILVTANHYDLSLYNGDVGVLHCFSSPRIEKREFGREDYLLFPDGRRFSPSALSSFTWGYAASVHKSQGSEYEEVLLLAPKGSEAFGREVLYTAVTRAKKRVTIASTKELIVSALKTSSRRQSGVLRRSGGLFADEVYPSKNHSCYEHCSSKDNGEKT